MDLSSHLPHVYATDDVLCVLHVITKLKKKRVHYCYLQIYEP